MWCRTCNSETNEEECPICGKKTKYMSTDLRPVFPEERLLVEILLDKKPNEYVERSVWAINNRYYIDGKSISIPNEVFQTADTDAIRGKLDRYSSNNTYEYFDACF